MKFKLKIFLIALTSFFSLTSIAQTTDEIVTKHIIAVGGKENWDKVKSMKMEAMLKAQGAEVKISTVQIDKKAQRQNISVMGMTGYSIVTNTEGWNFMPFQGQTKPEPMTADDVKNSQDDLYIQDDFITYTELGKKLEFIGKDDFDGIECLKLKMTDKNNQETSYFIDPTNYFVIKQISKMKSNGQEFENVTTFGNYKKLPEGIVFPMSITSNFGEMSIEKLEINPTIDESEFKVPAK